MSTVVYSDVAYGNDGGCEKDVFGWAFVIVEDGAVRSVKRGRRSFMANLGDHPERYPAIEGLRACRHHNRGRGTKEVEIRSDVPSKIYPPSGVTVNYADKTDPFHLICHYAARDVYARGQLKRLAHSILSA